MTENKSKDMWHTAKPNAQGFDEIRIVTVPRFKQSETSGDEWRISSVIEFWRHGRKVHVASGGSTVENSVLFLGGAWLRAHDDGHARFTGEGDLCDQEGCGNIATVKLQLKKGFHRDGSDRPLAKQGEYRQFCNTHSHRGDCGLEDADRNYTVIDMTTGESQQ